MADHFDTAAFYSALNAVRAKRGLTWKDVATQAGINASTLTRIGQGKKPDVNGLAALLVWSNLKAETFMPNAGRASAEPIAEISKIIRRDKTLSTNSAKIIEEIVRNTYISLRNRDDGS